MMQSLVSIVQYLMKTSRYSFSIPRTHGHGFKSRAGTSFRRDVSSSGRWLTKQTSDAADVNCLVTKKISRIWFGWESSEHRKREADKKHVGACLYACLCVWEKETERERENVRQCVCVWEKEGKLTLLFTSLFNQSCLMFHLISWFWELQSRNRWSFPIVKQSRVKLLC